MDQVKTLKAAALPPPVLANTPRSSLPAPAESSLQSAKSCNSASSSGELLALAPEHRGWHRPQKRAGRWLASVVRIRPGADLGQNGWRSPPMPRRTLDARPEGRQAQGLHRQLAHVLLAFPQPVVSVPPHPTL